MRDVGDLAKWQTKIVASNPSMVEYKSYACYADLSIFLHTFMGTPKKFNTARDRHAAKLKREAVRYELYVLYCPFCFTRSEVTNFDSEREAILKKRQKKYATDRRLADPKRCDALTRKKIVYVVFSFKLSISRC